jgi:hypothetical protein
LPETLTDNVALEAGLPVLVEEPPLPAVELPLLADELLPLLDAPLFVEVAAAEPVLLAAVLLLGVLLLGAVLLAAVLLLGAALLLAAVSLDGDALAALAVDTVVADVVDAAELVADPSHAANKGKRMLKAA